MQEATTVDLESLQCSFKKNRWRRLNPHPFWNQHLTLFEPAFFGSSKTRGGADLPPPSKNGGNGWEVPKIELEPHILPRLIPDKRIYDF